MADALPAQGGAGIVPLRKWIEDEARRRTNERREPAAADDVVRKKKQSLIRKATVAYGAVELLAQSKRLRPEAGKVQPPPGEWGIDKFVVHVDGATSQPRPWNDVRGVGMVAPALSVRLSEPSFLLDQDDRNNPDRMGRYLEAEACDAGGRLLPALDDGEAIPAESDVAATNIDKGECRSLGAFLYELYSGTSPFLPGELRRGSSLGSAGDASSTGSAVPSPTKEPARKVRYDKKKGKSYSTTTQRPYATLQELGHPSSICVLVQNLIDGHDAYSLESARSDLHLLLSDPDCFLFDIEDTATTTTMEPGGGGSAMSLQIRKGKLYGRDEEVGQITDAFCQVSAGKNAAFFIGGYSGSGKTMLVQSLKARVDVTGGYVLTEKVDQMSKEKPLLGVLSAFNNLCLLIKEKCSSHELLEMAGRFVRDFESDYTVVAQLLPNMSVLFPELKAREDASGAKQTMNLHNVCFTLQRFLRIVSSRLRPVMLFLDDLQWAAAPTFDLVLSLLTDTEVGSSCFFFVGSYRDNEVEKEHPIFALMASLESKDVELMTLSLGGLAREDVNAMISETLVTFPRLCRPLSDIVSEKTKGNPLFVIEFLKSLISSSLLRYSLRERRWIWDEEKIRHESVTDNVLYLLTSKMTSLPENLQTALKVASCFGIRFSSKVVGYLCSTLQYARLREWLDQAKAEGFVCEAGTDLAFVHDKVREAAYSLIPDDEKSQFHHELGTLLLSATAGVEDIDEMIFQIADQIRPALAQPEQQQAIAKLNFDAGSRAMELSDYETALSYLDNAASLLPDYRWERSYEFSLRLFFLRGKAAYTCGNTTKACDSLKEVIDKARSIDDKILSYYLYATILHVTEERNASFTTCREVLSQLNETIPDSIDMKALGLLIKDTSGRLAKLTEDELVNMREMQDKTARSTLKFYTLLTCIAFWLKSEMMPFFGCRMIELTLEHGVCPDSVFGLVQLAGVLSDHLGKRVEDIKLACRVGQMAMALYRKRFDSPEMLPKVYFCYYGFVAINTEPLQICASNLRRGFEVGMSSGEDVSMSFYNSMRLASSSLFCGAHLPSILKETDYHLELARRLNNKLPMQALTTHRETMSLLIDRGQSTRSDAAAGTERCANDEYSGRHNVTIYLNRAVQSFWLGYSQRCNHYSKKALETPGTGRFVRVTILFYASINAFRGVPNANGNGSQFIKAKALYKDALEQLQFAVELCPWNYAHKMHLLLAEMSSFEGKTDEAQASYASAIAASAASRHIHEQGLSCELAALQYRKLGQVDAALAFLQKAKECYAAWGSQMKVESIDKLAGALVAAK